MIISSTAPARLIAALLSLAAVPSVSAIETSFWVWHRSSTPTAEEIAQLQPQQVRVLYWHIGQLEWSEGAWRWRQPPATAPVVSGLHIVPVVRLETAGQASLEEVLAPVRQLIEDQQLRELEIDYDCPDRLLGDYSNALRRVHALAPRLTITALADWIDDSAFDQLAKTVDEIAPMFYDLEIDPVNQKMPGPLPLIDPEKVAAQLHRWSRCPIPWRAGLPSFARVTVYDSLGKSRGHIRSWSWDDVCFNKSLAATGPTSLGTTLFRVLSASSLAATPIKSGEFVAARWPDRLALARAIGVAKQNGARGVSFFRLPDGTDPSGWSLRTLGNLEPDARPRLLLRKSGGQNFVLVNESAVDLEPRLSGLRGEQDRGYALELDAPATIWREAIEGDFWRVMAHANPDAPKPVAVAVPLATRITFWFSHLRAGESLRTGLIQLAPAALIESIRYRVLDCPGTTEWQKIE